jgi:hypothetical protein
VLLPPEHHCSPSWITNVNTQSKYIKSFSTTSLQYTKFNIVIKPNFLLLIAIEWFYCKNLKTLPNTQIVMGLHHPVNDKPTVETETILHTRSMFSKHVNCTGLSSTHQQWRPLTACLGGPLPPHSRESSQKLRTSAPSDSCNRQTECPPGDSQHSRSGFVLALTQPVPIALQGFPASHY